MKNKKQKALHLISLDLEEELEHDSPVEKIEAGDLQEEEQAFNQKKKRQRGLSQAVLFGIVLALLVLGLMVLISHQRFQTKPKTNASRTAFYQTSPDSKKAAPNSKEKTQKSTTPSSPHSSSETSVTPPVSSASASSTTPQDAATAPSPSTTQGETLTVSTPSTPSGEAPIKTLSPEPNAPVITYIHIDLIPFIGQSAEPIIKALTGKGATVHVQYQADSTQASGIILDVEGRGTVATLTVSE